MLVAASSMMHTPLPLVTPPSIANTPLLGKLIGGTGEGGGEGGGGVGGGDGGGGGGGVGGGGVGGGGSR